MQEEPLNLHSLTLVATKSKTSLSGPNFCRICFAAPAKAFTELVEARARLLEAYQNVQTDNDNNVRQLRAKINALEYVAAAVVTLPRLRPTIAASSSRQQPTPPRGYEIISDAELLAEIRDRSRIVVKQRNGTNDFVLVGQ